MSVAVAPWCVIAAPLLMLQPIWFGTGSSFSSRGQTLEASGSDHRLASGKEKPVEAPVSSISVERLVVDPRDYRLAPWPAFAKARPMAFRENPRVWPISSRVLPCSRRLRISGSREEAETDGEFLTP